MNQTERVAAVRNSVVLIDAAPREARRVNMFPIRGIPVGVVPLPRVIN